MPMLSVSVFRLWGRGVCFEMLGGFVPPEHCNWALASTAAHTHTANTMGVRPPGLKVFCIHYFECAVLCTWGVAGFYSHCSPLLSRSTNFHSSKHKTDLPIWDSVWTERRGRMKTFSLEHVSIEDISSYFVELTSFRSPITIDCRRLFKWLEFCFASRTIDFTLQFQK